MKVFLTGGSGFIGNRLIERLLSEYHEVRLLLRDPKNIQKFQDKNIAIIKGDLLDEEVLMKGMEGCDWVFHLAAFTKPWSKDPNLSFKTNVTGTKNVLEAALKCGVKKIVITSTGGTMSFSHDCKPVNELTNLNPVFHTAYEATKAEAERIAADYCIKGLHVVIVNPTRVFGPGKLSTGNSLTKIIKWYIAGFWRIMPGNGEPIGNYVFIDDVVDGYLRAIRSGRKGERYILGGENLSFKELFTILGEAAGRKRRMFYLSKGSLQIIMKTSSLLTKTLGIPPLITRDWIDKYMKNWIMSSEKAINELGYKITPFRDGVVKTISWLKLNQNKNW
jgi:nucleoside-diphosphate-sugar epimerase